MKVSLNRKIHIIALPQGTWSLLVCGPIGDHRLPAGLVRAGGSQFPNAP